MPLGLRLIAHFAALAALAAFGLALGRTLREGGAGNVVLLVVVAAVLVAGMRRLYFAGDPPAPARSARSVAATAPAVAAAPAVAERRASEEEGPLWAAENVVGEAAPVAADVRVDLNAASVVDLQRLPGIGPVAAQRIVDERSAGGPFRSVEDLVRVPGIGPARVRVLAELVRT